jgi:putative ABC transport system permease protein
MRAITAAIHRIRSLFALRRADHALDDEMQFHLEMETQQLVRAGMAADAARAAALRSFGGVARHRDEARDARGISLIEDFLTDVRLATRMFGRQPAFAVLVVLTLGVGIGTITSVFGTVYSVILEPLPYHESSRIAVLWERNAVTGNDKNEASPANFLDFESRNRTFMQVAASDPWSFDYAGNGEPVSFNTALVTQGFFEVFRVRPILGRVLQPTDHAQGAPPVVVFSEKLWRTRFGADPSLIGRTFLLDGLSRRVVGIMPFTFDLPRGEDIWAPKIFDPGERRQRAGNWLAVVGRLRDGVTLEQANADLQRVSLDLAREYPASNEHARTWAEPIETTLFGPVRATLFTLLGAAGFVLAIVCANTGALIVTRTMQRDRELTVRAALGAGRSRLLRQLTAETATLAVAGGAIGILLAIAGTAAIRQVAPVALPRVESIGVSIPVLAFSAAITVLTCLLSTIAAFGAVRRAGRSHIGAPAAVGRRTQWSRPILVGVESALALVLVVGAGLLIRSFARVTSVDAGFRADDVVTTVVQTWNYYPEPANRVVYAADMIGRLRRIPGVSAAAMTTSAPLSPPIGMARVRVTFEGATTEQEARTFHVAAIAGDYFEAMRIPLHTGRLFTQADAAGSLPVAIVSQRMARQVAGDGNPIGKRITFPFQGRPIAREIVGIVGDVRQRSLEADPIASIYIPHGQNPSGAMTFVVRGANTDAIIPFARRTLIEANPLMPLEPTVPFSSYLSSAVRERKFHLSLLTTFAAVALGLAMLGIYGVANQAATERTREIGLRVAIGATAADIVRLILRQGAVIVTVGIVSGLAAAFAVTRLLRSLLYGVTPLDPITFAAGVGLLFVLAIIASWIPARRASVIDPVRALRAD